MVARWWLSAGPLDLSGHGQSSSAEPVCAIHCLALWVHRSKNSFFGRKMVLVNQKQKNELKAESTIKFDIFCHFNEQREKQSSWPPAASNTIELLWFNPPPQIYCMLARGENLLSPLLPFPSFFLLVWCRARASKVTPFLMNNSIEFILPRVSQSVSSSSFYLSPAALSP